jgi:hypothetical protein
MAESCFTAGEVVLLCEIFEVPCSAEGFVVTSFTHIPPVLSQLWSSTTTKGDFKQIMTGIARAINLASPAVVNRCRLHLARWDVIGSTNPSHLTESPGGSGPAVINYPKERANIRHRLSNLLGVYVPPGGFESELKRKLRFATECDESGGR